MTDEKKQVKYRFPFVKNAFLFLFIFICILGLIQITIILSRVMRRPSRLVTPTMALGLVLAAYLSEIMLRFFKPLVRINEKGIRISRYFGITEFISWSKIRNFKVLEKKGKLGVTYYIGVYTQHGRVCIIDLMHSYKKKSYDKIMFSLEEFRNIYRKQKHKKNK